MTENVFTIAGRKVVRRCSAEKMEEFVRKLPLAQKRDDREVLKALLGAGMVSIEPDK